MSFIVALHVSCVSENYLVGERRQTSRRRLVNLLANIPINSWRDAARARLIAAPIPRLTLLGCHSTRNMCVGRAATATCAGVRGLCHVRKHQVQINRVGFIAPPKGLMHWTVIYDDNDASLLPRHYRCFCIRHTLRLRL